jgi:hypothetical protein
MAKKARSEEQIMRALHHCFLRHQHKALRGGVT